MNVKQAVSVFDRAEAEALAVVDGLESRKVVGLLTEATPCGAMPRSSTRRAPASPGCLKTDL